MAQIYVDSKGYKRFSDSDNSVHRWAAGKKLGRPLKETEVVHHIDRNKKNNNPGNLYVFKSQAAHDRVHKKDARKYGKRYSYKGRRSN
jgi:hypothetical protein